jgi:hypothetical protein
MWRLVWWRVFRKLHILFFVSLFLFQFSEAQDLRELNLIIGNEYSLAYVEPNFQLDYTKYSEINLFEHTDKKRIIANWKIDSTGRIFQLNRFDYHCDCDNKQRQYNVLQSAEKKTISSFYKTKISKEYCETTILYDSLNRIIEQTDRYWRCYKKNCKKNKYDTTISKQYVIYPSDSFGIHQSENHFDTLYAPFNDLHFLRYKDSIETTGKIVKREFKHLHGCSDILGGPSQVEEYQYIFSYNELGQLATVESNQPTYDFKDFNYSIPIAQKKIYVLNYNDDGSLATISIKGYPHYTFEYKPKITK